jgi:hypothetical protein
MDTPTLSTFIMPSVYAGEALASARAGPLAELPPNLLIVRLCIDLTEDNIADANAALKALEAQDLAGWPLYQVTTCGVFLAIKAGEPAHIISALDAWLTGMANYPSNWQIGVLQAPEVKPFLSGFPPERLQLPPPAKKPAITRKERDFVQDKPNLVLRAVNENLAWFKELGVDGAPEVIARWYRLGSVSLELKECYLQTTRDLPDIVCSLDDDGHFQGSFFLH